MLIRMGAIALLLVVPALAHAGLVLTQIGNPDRTSALTLNLCCNSSVLLASPLDTQTLEESEGGPGSGYARAKATAQDSTLRLDIFTDSVSPGGSAHVMFIFQVDATYLANVSGAFAFEGSAAPNLQIGAIVGNERDVLLHYEASNKGDATPTDGLALGDLAPNATVFHNRGATSFLLNPGETYTLGAWVGTGGSAANGTMGQTNGFVVLELQAVPEPSTAWLVAVALMAGCLRAAYSKERLAVDAST